jgi:hypothetical protein
MIFCHIVDDYKLQAGILNNLKQKKFWEENAPDEMYKYDYIWALIMHSFSWAFMVMLPIAFVNEFKVNDLFVFIFVCNLVVHAVTDDLKANKRIINLWTDQLVHIGQIILTSMFLF